MTNYPLGILLKLGPQKNTQSLMKNQKLYACVCVFCIFKHISMCTFKV